MILLNPSDHGFWDSLASFGDYRYQVDFPACSFEGSCCLSREQFFTDGWLSFRGGLSFRKNAFVEAYAEEDSGTLTLFSASRDVKIMLRPIRLFDQSEFRFFCQAFATDLPTGNFQPPKLVCPELCPCCRESAEVRIRELQHNPLTAILAIASGSHSSLLVSSKSNEAAVVIEHHPVDILQNRDRLISSGEENGLSISVSYLYSFYLSREMIEGVLNHKLCLHDPHGRRTCRFFSSRPEDGSSWQAILNRSRHQYPVFER